MSIGLEITHSRLGRIPRVESMVLRDTTGMFEDTCSLVVDGYHDITDGEFRVELEGFRPRSFPVFSYNHDYNPDITYVTGRAHFDERTPDGEYTGLADRAFNSIMDYLLEGSLPAIQRDPRFVKIEEDARNTPGALASRYTIETIIRESLYTVINYPQAVGLLNEYGLYLGSDFGIYTITETRGESVLRRPDEGTLKTRVSRADRSPKALRNTKIGISYPGPSVDREYFYEYSPTSLIQDGSPIIALNKKVKGLPYAKTIAALEWLKMFAASAQLTATFDGTRQHQVRHKLTIPRSVVPAHRLPWGFEETEEVINPLTGLFIGHAAVQKGEWIITSTEQRWSQGDWKTSIVANPLSPVPEARFFPNSRARFGLGIDEL